MSLIRTSIKALLIAQSIKTSPTFSNARFIKRWVAPTLRELRKRQQKLGPQEPQPRAGFIEWNYRSELFAFSKRLNEEFQLPMLQTAFTNRSYILREEKRQRDLGVEETDIQMEDNRKLADIGENLIKEYVQEFLKHSLPKVPEVGQKAFTSYLLREDTLAYVALHLGVKDLIFSAEYPPKEETLATTLQAIVGALEQSSGAGRAFLFVRDFICTQLNQRDLLELWQIDNPEELLKQVLKERQMSEPEPRLIGDCAKNTVLAAYQVGIYSNKKLVGIGFGEDLNTAIQTASLDALRVIFGIQDNMAPFDFQLDVEAKNKKLAAK